MGARSWWEPCVLHAKHCSSPHPLVFNTSNPLVSLPPCTSCSFLHPLKSGLKCRMWVSPCHCESTPAVGFPFSPPYRQNKEQLSHLFLWNEETIQQGGEDQLLRRGISFGNCQTGALNWGQPFPESLGELLHLSQPNSLNMVSITV